jgi:hypothetical protein
MGIRHFAELFLRGPVLVTPPTKPRHPKGMNVLYTAE